MFSLMTGTKCMPANIEKAAWKATGVGDNEVMAMMLAMDCIPFRVNDSLWHLRQSSGYVSCWWIKPINRRARAVAPLLGSSGRPGSFAGSAWLVQGCWTPNPSVLGTVGTTAQ
jgi:hypothetical protein